MNCEFCSSPVHVWFQCPKKPDGWKPARLSKTSTAARKPSDVQARVSPRVARASDSGVGKPPVDTNLVVACPEVGEKASVGHHSKKSTDEGESQKPETVSTVSRDGYDGDPATSTKFNKNAYMAVYMREVYRPRLKEKKEAAK